MPIGFSLWDKYLGDVLYAAVFYLGLSLIWPKGPIPPKAAMTAGYVLVVESFQLTPIPGQLGQSDSVMIRVFAYLVLGSKFSGWDLLAYGVGIAGIALIDRFYLES